MQCMNIVRMSFYIAGAAISACCGCSKNSTEPDDTEPIHTDFEVDTGEDISTVSATIHPEAATILIVRWTQKKETAGVSIRFTFENDEWFETPAKPGTLGPHEEVLLGIPEKTSVQFYFEQDVDGADGGAEAFAADGGAADTALFHATAGEIPSDMPRPTVLSYDANKAGKERWLLGSVEDTPADDRYYTGPFWIYIIDRKGRIIWYYSDRGDNPCMAFPRVARDGSHLYIEKRMFYNSDSYSPKVLKMTLDYNQQEEISVPDLDDCIDVTDDGGVLFNVWSKNGPSGLREMRPDGEIVDIWDCRAWAVETSATALSANYCYSNTVNWNPLDDTVVMSFPYLNTAVEIDRETGALVSQWGDVDGSSSFVPSTWEFEFNHFANITPDGTLLISSHAPGHEESEVPGEHRFIEFDIDRQNRRLVEKWVYGEGMDDWPMYKGEAHRTASGNTLVNYGTGGIIREVTPNKETAWHVQWDADFKDDRFNKMVGHNVLLDDLYALCRGFVE